MLLATTSTTSDRVAVTHAQGALAAMPQPQATALLLAVKSGLTYREIAQRLGEEPAVVLRWITDGLRAMRPARAGIAWT